MSDAPIEVDDYFVLADAMAVRLAIATPEAPFAFAVADATPLFGVVKVFTRLVCKWGFEVESLKPILTIKASPPVEALVWRIVQRAGCLH